jgi:hypothetical protein
MITLQEVARARWLAVVLLVLAVTGCGVWPPDTQSASPSPLPGDRPVFMVEGGAGGFTPFMHQALITPSIAVYGDGRVIQFDGKQAPDMPAAYLISNAAAADVAAFAADAEKRDLINEETDFATPA